MTSIATDPCVLLEANRARLRLHFRATAAQSGSPTHGPQAAPHWVAALAALAQGGTASDCVLAWWKSLPLSRALDVVAQAAQDALKPVAQRYPVRLVAGALVAGAALVWLRPWRWVTAGAMAASVVAVADQLARAAPHENGWSAFIDVLFQKKGPPRP